MTPLEEHIKRSITQQNWAQLFVECLHWNRLDEPALNMHLGEDNRYQVLPTARLGGVKVFEAVAMENSKTRKHSRILLAKRVQKISYHHLILFPEIQGKIIFLCMRDGERHFEAPLTPPSPSVAQVCALKLLAFPIRDEEPKLDEVVLRLKQMFQKRQYKNKMIVKTQRLREVHHEQTDLQLGHFGHG